MTAAFLAMLVSATVTAGAAQAPAPSTPADVAAFAAALESCTAATARTPHPLMASFTVEHTVSGEANGTCGYRQSMPGKMTMVCALSVEGRKALASDVRKMAAGESMKGSTSALQPPWARECEIELPSGARTPFVQEKKRSNP